ncbi:hypothetical protein FA15DRAFT_654414 [Coprinopsis marcescibilis]|uniref:Kinetochore protein NDC80 n=1 Tax=Coprinopsis marcescibilis TaxID=230819 RepID=A0A5C3L0I9_COPMA|nr:hypothetical protein FA15DRAFT_654414 [Coprinopsis marcescibilis]
MDSVHRRSILSESHARSNLPMPSTAKKPTTSKSRMSLAGPAIRPTPQQLMPPPSMNPRQSIASRPPNFNPLLMSASKSNVGRTPLQNVRRGSIWGGAIAAPSGSQTAKDTRPLRDRQYQGKMRQDILQYLQLVQVEGVTMHTLTNIQGKDYRFIFETLLSVLEPDNPLVRPREPQNQQPQPRFEDVLIPSLKYLRYPYVHQIDNKWLAAPASMHSWPYLLGVLHWLVELCKLRDSYLDSGHPSVQDVQTVPEEFDEPLDHAALAFGYFEETYQEWLEMRDEFPEPNQRMEDRYAQRNNSIQMEVEEQSKRLKGDKAALEELESSAPPIDKLVRDNGLLKGDGEKFQKILKQYETRKKKLLDAIAYEKTEMQRDESQVEGRKQELERLQEIVTTQNLSPEEVHKMNTDHEMLSRGLQELKQKIADTHKTIMTLEVSVTNRVAAAEEAIDVYTNLLSSLDLFPPLPEPWQDIDLTLELNSAVSNPQQLLVGSDVRKVLKPTLSAFAESKRGERSSVENERIKRDDDLDQVTLECENIDEELSELFKKVSVLSEQADDLRDAAQQEALVASQEATRLERDLAQARTAALASGMGIKSRLQSLQFAYREQQEKFGRLKEETVRAIIKSSHDIAMFKEEVSKHIRELREFAESD